MIRILVADPAARVRAALRMRLDLEPDMSVVAECASLSCAERVACTGVADVLVVDLVSRAAADRPDAAWLQDGGLPCAVVLLSMDDALAGLSGPRLAFVSKYAGESAVVDAVRRTHGGGVPRPRADVPERPAPSRGGPDLLPKS